MQEYEDIRGKKFDLRIWCKRLKKDSEKVTEEEKKGCHRCCSACADGEQY